VEWRGASLGAGLIDVVRLARDSGVPVRPLAERYADAVGVVLLDGALDMAVESVS
jgi:hypothetical protein